MTLAEAVAQAIKEVLAGMYDESGRYPGNPDYFGDAEIEEIIARFQELYQP